MADWHPTVDGQVAAIEMARRAGVPVPDVLYASGRVLAYRYVQGASIRPGACPPEMARRVGRLHGRLHRIVGDGLGPVVADGRSARWSADAVFRDVGAWAERLLSAPDPSPIGKEDVEAAASLMLAHRPETEARLVHGDASPANTIVAAGRVAALIDFDDAWFGDPAGDMAWWWNDPETSADFDAGCAETASPASAPTVWLYRLRLLLGLADTFAFTHPERAARIGAILRTAVIETERAVAEG